MFKNKIILITGGTGSFGSSMIKYLIKKKINFKEIRILSRDEKKQDDMRSLYKNPKIVDELKVLSEAPARAAIIAPTIITDEMAFVTDINGV